MKTLISIVFTLIVMVQSFWANDLPPSNPEFRICGGVIAVVTVGFDADTGNTVVLPVRLKMLPEVEGNSFWNRSLYFGPTVTVLPPQTIQVISGYVGQYHGTRNYSFDYPIYIQTTTDGITWTNEFYFTLEGAAAKSNPYAGPFQSSDVFGSVRTKLYAGSNTNGLDITSYSTNSLMKRYGLGSCRSQNDDYDSRSTVAFVFLNLPPKLDGGIEGCSQPGTNFFEHLWFENCDTNEFMLSYCDPLDYEPGFAIDTACNSDNPRNWPYIDTPYPSYDARKTYRIAYDGSSFYPPQLLMQTSKSNISLSIDMVAGVSYSIDYTANLLNPEWHQLWMFEGSGTVKLFDSMTNSKRFYRLNYWTNQ